MQIPLMSHGIISGCPRVLPQKRQREIWQGRILRMYTREKSWTMEFANETTRGTVTRLQRTDWNPCPLLTYRYRRCAEYALSYHRFYRQ